MPASSHGGAHLGCIAAGQGDHARDSRSCFRAGLFWAGRGAEGVGKVTRQGRSRHALPSVAGRSSTVGGERVVLRTHCALMLGPARNISSWLARWFPKVPAKPVVALKTPIKVELVAGKTYRWCVCGRSKKQPFCDGSHFFQRTGLSPLKFKAQETRTVALCTCKASQKPPFCDGTHKNESIQKAEVGSPV